MDSIAQGFTGSLFLMSYYILIASGLAITFSILRVINFAHGQFYMLGSFVVYFVFAQWGLNFYLAALASMAFMAVVGMLMERFYFRIMGDRELPAVIGALGIAIVIERLMAIRFASMPLPVPYVHDGRSTLGPLALPNQRLLVIVAAAVIMVGLMLFISRSRLGKAMRAVAQDPVAAAAQGINVNMVRLTAMAIGGALAGAAGALNAPLFQAYVYSGLLPMLKGFIIIILGGLGSLGGAVVGGAILGLVDGYGTIYLGHTANALGFAIVMVVLILRPQGLLGRERE